MTKKLYKSRNRILCGVCGGVAEFFNIDPTIVRLVLGVVTLGGFGTGVIIYIVAAIVMPDRTIDNGYGEENNADANMRDANNFYYKRGNGQNSDDEFNSYFKNDKK